MTTGRDEAVRLADEWFNGATAVRRQIGVHEFVHGYVLWAEGPPGADPDRPPASVGEGCVVVDRASGVLMPWPPLPAVVIAERYRP